jgi:hypothetical protein
LKSQISSQISIADLSFREPPELKKHKMRARRTLGVSASVAFHLNRANNSGSLRCRDSRVHADKLATAAFIFKLHDAVDQREQSIVLAATNICTRLPLGATLARQNVATQDALAAKFLQPEPL